MIDFKMKRKDLAVVFFDSWGNASTVAKTYKDNFMGRLVNSEILTFEASRGKTCQPLPKAMQIKGTQLKLPGRTKQVKFCHLAI